MLCLVHSENELAVRNFVLKTAKDLKKSGIVEMDLDASTDFTSLEGILQPNLFGENPLACLNATKATKETVDKLTKLLNSYHQTDILVYTYKNLPKNSVLLNSLEQMKAKIINIPAAKSNEVFVYTSHLFNKNRQAAYKSLQNLLEKDNDPNFILSMIQYQLRNIALVKYGLGNKMAPFQASQAQKQSANFDDIGIIRLYEAIYKLESRFKNGLIDPDLICAIATEQVLQ